MIEGIIKGLETLIESVKSPFPPFPSALLAITTPFRSGLSAKSIASEIITNQTKAGAPFGPMPDGSKNIAEAMEVIRIESIVKALHEDSKIQITIPPGGIEVVTYGTNEGGPMVARGTNILPVYGTGVIS